MHADHIARDAAKFSLLILPNVASMSAGQIASVVRYVQNGGNLFATGQSSLFDEAGQRQKDYALGDLFGAHVVSDTSPADDISDLKRTAHTYLRLTPELRSQVYGPRSGNEPPATGQRHPVLKGFDETDILAFGGILKPVTTVAGAQTIVTFIPEFPIYPPETAWMRESKTDIPGLILNTLSNGSRVAFMPADIDRQFARYNLPDHGDLLANTIRWASKDNIPLSVECAGLVDCNIYSQPGRMILHVTNLTSAATWRQPIHELIPIGPVSIRIKVGKDVKGEKLNLLVSGEKVSAKIKDGWSEFEISSILSHEVVVIT